MLLFWNVWPDKPEKNRLLVNFPLVPCLFLYEGTIGAPLVYYVAALIHRADQSSGKQLVHPLLTLRCWHFKWKKKKWKKFWMVTRQGHATSKASVNRWLWDWKVAVGVSLHLTRKLMDLLDRRNLVCKSRDSLKVITHWCKTQSFHSSGIVNICNVASVSVCFVCPSNPLKKCINCRVTGVTQKAVHSCWANRVSLKRWAQSLRFWIKQLCPPIFHSQRHNPQGIERCHPGL